LQNSTLLENFEQLSCVQKANFFKQEIQFFRSGNWERGFGSGKPFILIFLRG